jgi:hypothetical protein
VKVILETDWLLLRECAEDDAEVFFKLNTDPQVLRFRQAVARTTTSN